MPGIAAVFSHAPIGSLNELLDRMLDQMTHYSWYQTDQYVAHDRSTALGRTSLGFVNAASQPAWNGDRSVGVVLDGELFDLADRRRELAAAEVSFEEENHAQLLLEGYCQFGRSYFDRLEGKYSACIWDARRREAIIVNDRFGMRPLYYACLPGRLIVASEIKAILADPDVSRSRDMRGLSQFFTFGHFWGERTFLAQVRALPPGARFVYSLDADQLATDRYWRAPQPSLASDRSQVALFDEITDRVQHAVTRQTSGTARLGIALSGGLDSRTILAAIDGQATPLRSVSLGVPDCLDHRCAKRLAELAHCDHRCFDLDDGIVSQFEQHMRRMVHLTDGHYLDQCIVMPTLPLYRKLGIDVLLRGHAGELFHMDKAYNFSLDSSAWSISTDGELEDWLMRRLSAYMLDGLSGPLMVDMENAELESQARLSLRESLDDSRGAASPVQRIARLFVTHRLPRETASSLAKIGSLVETRVPLLDRELIALILAVPPRLRLGDRIQTHILRRLKPEFTRVVNANTGAPLGAGRLRVKASSLAMRVLARLGVPGYRGYENLGLWLRRDLRDWVRQVLLDDRCLDRGAFHPDTVTQVVDRHLNQGCNHTFLLMAMMIYELGQREFIDGDPCRELLDSSIAR